MSMLKRRGVFALLCVACLTIMVGCVIVPGLPGIATALGLSQEASWLVTLPSLGVVIFGPFAGHLITRLGSRQALRIGLALYGALGLACIWLSNAVLIFSDRLLLGGATAIVMASGTGLLSDFFEGHARLKMIALQGMAIELGGVIFLSLGGLLASMGWQWPFSLYLMSWVFLVLVELFVPYPPVKPVASPQTEADRGSVLGKLARIYIAALLSMTVFFTAIISLPRRLEGIHFSEAQTGYFLSFVSLVAVGAAWFLPKICRRIGEQNTLRAGFLAYAAAHALFASMMTAVPMIGAAIMLGTGFGLTVPLVNHLTIERTHSVERGSALAYLSVAIFMGQFLSSFLEYLPGNISSAFIAAIILALGGVAVSGRPSL
ncbi:MFS transporter [Gluconobacter sp. LMG 1744]|nr:permease [Gluconobacter albidus]MBF0891639.1 MFS transporter [Gluconobacter cadivus]MBN3868344.1 MFS transporter [Gluconobacter kondonii]QQX92494.1 MFS transporter [Gluconobacter sphaericus]